MRILPLILAATIGLSACANHPLPDDRVDYSTFDIVQKVRCEAQEEITDYLKKIKWYDQNLKFNTIEDRLRSITRESQDNFNTTAVLNGEHKLLGEKKKALVARLSNIRRANDYVFRIREVILDQLSSNPSEPKRGELEKRLVEIDTQVFTLTQRKQTLDVEIEGVEKALSELSGKHDLNSASERAKNIKSEKEALAHLAGGSENGRNLALFRNTILAARLEFDIVENNNASVTGAIVWPIHLGKLSLGGGAGLEKKRSAVRTVKFTSTFADLTRDHELDCHHQSSRSARKYPITGQIGVDELIEQYNLIRSSTTIVSGEDTFTDKLTFTTKLRAGLQPSVEITPVSPSSIKISSDFSSDRIDVHQLIVHIYPATAQAPKTTTQVEIVNLPDLAVEFKEGLAGTDTIIEIR